MRNGLIAAGLNHGLHRLQEINNGPWEYNGKMYYTKNELYTAILLDTFSDQFGITDIAAMIAAIDYFGFLDKPFQMGKDASKGTSYTSKYGAKLSPQQMPKRLPTHFRNGSIRYTKTLGRFLGRLAGPAGWAILTYDVSMTVYRTQTTYNSIINKN